MLGGVDRSQVRRTAVHVGGDSSLIASGDLGLRHEAKSLVSRPDTDIGGNLPRQVTRLTTTARSVESTPAPLRISRCMAGWPLPEVS